MQQRALVTGARGFLGSHLVERLAREGWGVRATDLPGLVPGRARDGVEWVASDLTRRETLEPLVRGVDVVFHAGGLTDRWAPWERLYRVNVLGTENLLTAARRAGVRRVVNLSSFAVYGRFDRGRRPIDESHPVRPRDPYGRAKAMQDAVVWRFHDEGLPSTILRPGPCYGPRSRRGLATAFRVAARLPLVPVPVNFKQRVATVHAADVALAASLAARREEAAGQEYNLTDEGRYAFAEFLSLVASALGRRTVAVILPKVVARAGAGLLARASATWTRLRGKGRPWPERGTVHYLTFDFVTSNRKIRSLGFRFLYPDPRPGIEETIQELRREGYLE